jgi:hypothetical protein
MSHTGGYAAFSSHQLNSVPQLSRITQARRVFWIADNGSSHRGLRSVQRLKSRYPNAILVRTPVHASWLNQIEIYYSIVQRKVLTPNDFPGLQAVAARLSAFERHYESIAKPFQWTFTRREIASLSIKLETAGPTTHTNVAAAA